MPSERSLTPVEGIPDTSPIKQKMAMEHVMTEQEAMQEEIITRIPGPVAFLINYEMRPLIKIIAIIAAILVMPMLTLLYDAVELQGACPRGVLPFPFLWRRSSVGRAGVS